MLRIPQDRVTAVILGTAQDGGIPHIACHCPHCQHGWTTPHYAACLALIDTRPTQPNVWLIDATPDIKQQLHLLTHWLTPHPTMPHRYQQPTAIFLTHAHFGHIGGLPHLGPETMHAQNLNLYASAPLNHQLQAMPL
ncbi:MAG TPA: MBL fold metallo-hydrolase, partial [Anaerolineae bacterium]|nr:MBL fold metallo-hydrolase [Anaerolineae bacterium]